jgi:hypothetical protein
MKKMHTVSRGCHRNPGSKTVAGLMQEGKRVQTSKRGLQGPKYQFPHINSRTKKRKAPACFSRGFWVESRLIKLSSEYLRNFFGGFFQQHSRDDVQVAVVDDHFAFLGIGAL